MVNSFPKSIVVTCIETITAFNADRTVAWSVEQGLTYKGVLDYNTREYRTEDSEGRKVFIGEIDKNDVLILDPYFKLHNNSVEELSNKRVIHKYLY